MVGERFGSGPAHVAVLLGGTSGERAVSLETGRAIAAALERLGRRVTVVDLDGDDPLAPRWRLRGRGGEVEWQGSGPEALVGPLAGVDAYFLGLHGGFGEGGPLQGFLETAGCAYTGSGPAASSLCLDKEATLIVAEAHDVATAERLVERPLDFAELGGLPQAHFIAEVARLAERHGGVVLKPRRGGSSVATMVLQREEAHPAAIDHALRAIHTDGDVALVEARVLGVEVTAGFLEVDGRLLELPLVEIQPKPGRFFDYEEKYSSGGALELCPAQSLAPEVVRHVQRVGAKLYRALGCAGYARIDFIVRPSGEPVLLEANTLPGMTPRSLFPQAAQAAGFDFDAMCATILDHAWARRAGRAPKPGETHGAAPENPCK